MIITNKHNLPQSFVEMATEENKIEDGVYRVTSLLKGIRETMLFRRHHENVEQDAADMVWLLFGKATHHILEQQEEADTELKEERVKAKVGDYTVSGQFDLYCGEEKKITDYKTASVWKVIYKDYSDWKQQLLIYSWIMKQIGFEVKKGEVVVLLKDHSKSKVKYDSNYPQLPVQVVTFNFTEKDFKEIESWLKAKFEEVAKAEKMTDDELPLCTLEERFNDGGKYAVMNGKNKRAVRVLDTQEEAERYMEATGKGTHIEHRPGEDKKCHDYCSVNQFCNYYQGLMEKEVTA